MIRKVLLILNIAALAGIICPASVTAAESTYTAEFVLEDVSGSEEYRNAEVRAYLMDSMDEVYRVSARLNTDSRDEEECVSGIIRIPEDLEEDEYTVFLSLTDEDGDPVRLGGGRAFGVYGNYIGTIYTGDDEVDTDPLGDMYDKVIKICNGDDYVIVSGGCVLSRELDCMGAELETGEDGYEICCDPDEGIHWQYRDGLFFYETDEDTCYLAVADLDQLRIVTGNDRAALWTLEDDHLTTVSGRMTRYLTVSDGDFCLDTVPSTTRIFKRQ